MAAAGAWASGTTRPKAARTSPSQATSASVVSATMGTNQRSEMPESWSMRRTTNSSSAWIDASAAAIISGPRTSCQRRPDLCGCQAATGRDEDEAFAAPVGLAHVCATLPGLAQRDQLGQRARVDDVVARRAGAPGHEDAELLVVERR